MCSLCVLWWTAAAAGQEPDLQRGLSLLRQAEQLLGSADYAQAAERARQAAELGKGLGYVQQAAAEVLYRSGHTEESLPLFDRAVELEPQKAAHNWQRGLALCSLGKFEAGAAQFQSHHEVNPDDVENSAWYFLCIAKTKGLEAARATVIPSRGDGREPMMSVLRMLQGKLEPEGVLRAAVQNTTPGRGRRLAQFYADLYVGLYHDALGDREQAVHYLKRCQQYGIQGYMADCARVYLSDRFTPSAESEPSDNN